MFRVSLALALLVVGCDDSSRGVCENCEDAAPDVQAVDAQVVDMSLPVDGEVVDVSRPEDMRPVDAEVPVDVTVDVAIDVAVDAAIDVAVDAAIDLAVDAEPDQAVDMMIVLPPDAAPDAEPDAAPDAEPDLGPDAQVFDCPVGVEMPSEEICNGIDDDCDRVADEDFDVNEACEGVGRCGQGFIECTEEGGARCSTDPGGSVSQARDERCDGLDNDCDGDTDEGDLDTDCYDGPEDTQDRGICEGGRRICDEGRLQPCAAQVLPGVETCEGSDQDCDGLTDEGYEPILVCGTGVCRPTATPSACVGGEVLPCEPGFPEGDDADCDGVDQDCDGVADEGYVPDDSCGVGCGVVTPSRCVGGEVRPCEAGQPAANDATCDGRDDDCDERFDEDFVPDDECGVGVCAEGVTPSSCVEGVVTACAPADPLGEDNDCDGEDEDCDGRNDEGYVRIGECGVGVCALNPRPSSCINGNEIPCAPGPTQGNDASCDGVDQDCDGFFDEFYGSDANCGVGVCRDGNTPSMCVEGVESACAPGPRDADDDNDCDLEDDDCDGQIDEDVVVVAGAALRLTNDEANSTRPRTVANAAGFAVAWADSESGSAQIYLQRLNADGPVGDRTQVSVLGGNHFQPALAWNGQEYGLAWHSTRDFITQVYFARVDAAGAVVQMNTRISDGAADALHADIAWDGTNWAVAWTDHREDDAQVYVQLMSAAGAPVGVNQGVTAVDGAASVPALTSSPAGGFAALYNFEDAEGRFHVEFQAISAAGEPNGAPQRTNTGDANANGPRMVVTDIGFAATWYDLRDNNTEIYFAILDANGARQGDELRVTDNAHPSVLPTLAWTGSDYGIAWQDRRTLDHEVWFQHITGAGALEGPPQRVSDAPELTLAPSVAWQAGVFGISWYDQRDGNQEIYFNQGPMGCGP